VDAIALAGGFTRYAERERIVILRRDEKGVIRKIPVDFRAIATGDHSEMNLVILPGDTVIVP
jgi:polysaccharide export outer membrane protein